MRAAVQELQDAHFRDYQLWCATHPEDMMTELRHWEEADAHILSFPLSQQASYADYVTRHMCQESDDIVVAMATDMMNETPTHQANSCAIGNMALIVKTVLALPGHDDLKQRLDLWFKSVIAQQRNMSQCQLQ